VDGDGAICLNWSVVKKCVNVDQKQQLNNSKTITNPNPTANPNPRFTAEMEHHKQAAEVQIW